MDAACGLDSNGPTARCSGCPLHRDLREQVSEQYRRGEQDIEVRRQINWKPHGPERGRAPIPVSSSSPRRRGRRSAQHSPQSGAPPCGSLGIVHRRDDLEALLEAERSQRGRQLEWIDVVRSCGDRPERLTCERALAFWKLTRQMKPFAAARTRVLAGSPAIERAFVLRRRKCKAPHPRLSTHVHSARTNSRSADVGTPRNATSNSCCAAPASACATRRA